MNIILISLVMIVFCVGSQAQAKNDSDGNNILDGNNHIDFSLEQDIQKGDEYYNKLDVIFDNNLETTLFEEDKPKKKNIEFTKSQKAKLIEQEVDKLLLTPVIKKQTKDIEGHNNLLNGKLSLPEKKHLIKKIDQKISKNIIQINQNLKTAKNLAIIKNDKVNEKDDSMKIISKIENHSKTLEIWKQTNNILENIEAYNNMLNAKLSLPEQKRLINKIDQKISENIIQINQNLKTAKNLAIIKDIEAHNNMKIISKIENHSKTLAIKKDTRTTIKKANISVERANKKVGKIAPAKNAPAENPIIQKKPTPIDVEEVIRKIEQTMDDITSDLDIDTVLAEQEKFSL